MTKRCTLALPTTDGRMQQNLVVFCHSFCVERDVPACSLLASFACMQRSRGYNWPEPPFVTSTCWDIELPCAMHSTNEAWGMVGVLRHDL
jgi:hypothetical protein